jgi:hypothetical protein
MRAMANPTYTSGAPAIAMISRWILGGSYLATDTLTIAFGLKTYTITVGSTSLPQILSTLTAAIAELDPSVYPEFAEVTPNNDGATAFTLTANTAGYPFAATLSTNSTTGTIDGGTSSTGTITTANSGPTDWSAAANWSTGVVPQGALSAPSGLGAALAAGGALAANTYYYKITSINANGETTPSGEVNATTAGGNLSIKLTWTANPPATGYKVYRGTVTNTENVLVATINSGTAVQFTDDGASLTTPSSPPVSNTAVVTVPVQSNTSVAGSDSAFAGGTTYNYVITATTAGGETTVSNEKLATPAATNHVTLAWAAVTGATGYKIYRSTTPGTYTTPALVTTIVGGGTVTYNDLGAATSTGAPPGANTAVIPAPTSSACTTATTGGALAAGNYYYKVTATTAGGETTGSAEQTQATTGTASSVAVNWSLVTGATGYKVYRGVAAGSENTLIGTLGSTSTSFTDFGAIVTSATSPPGGNTATGDTPIIDQDGTVILYGLDNHLVAVPEIRVLADNVTVGLPKQNTNGYPEYRGDYLQLAATKWTLASSNTGRLKCNSGTTASTFNLSASGSGAEEGIPAVLILCNNSSTVLNASGGEVGVAWFGSETATIGTINVQGAAVVTTGAGCTLASPTVLSGTLTTNGAVGTAMTVRGGRVAMDGYGNCAQLSILGGTVTYALVGTLAGNTVVEGNGFVDFSQNPQPQSVTVTNPIAIKGQAAGGSDAAGALVRPYTLAYTGVGTPSWVGPPTNPSVQFS